MWSRWRIGLVALALLAGCTATPAAPPPVPPPQAAAPDYRVQVGDVLGLRLFLTPELDEDLIVRPDGRITTTLAEAVPAAGRTPEQIAADLRTIYGRELKDPRLTVEVRSPQPTRVYVAGEVLIPGELSTAGPPPTLLQAVSRAGGLRPTGDPDAVFVVRHGNNDRPQVIRTDYAAAATGGNPAADLLLAPFDVVVVPKTGIARVYLWVNQHIQQFVPVTWGFAYNLNPVVNNTQHP